MDTLAPVAPRPPEAESRPPGPRGYLGQFDLYRVAACAAVVAQHAFLWTVVAGNVTAWGFVMLLHFSRESFFFLSAFIVAYAQLTRPRTLWGFWRRRYVQMGVPYLVWTAIYFLFTLATQPGSVDDAWSLLGHDLAFGYYQLYFVVVLFQIYLVLPFLLWLLAPRRRRVPAMVVSALFALALAADLHYSGSFGPVGQATRWLGASLPWSRNLLTYQVFVVAGVLVALSLGAVLSFVARHWRALVAGSCGVGLATVGWYLGLVFTGNTTGRASDLYQPIAVVWFAAAITALFSLSWWWERRATVGNGSMARRSVPVVVFLANLTGGVFLSHVLFINLVRKGLGASGLGAHLPWAATVAILFLATLVVSGAFVALVLRTPLRWVLGGPVRSSQRARLGAPSTRPV